MKLTDLEPQFLVIEAPGHHRYVADISIAQGVQFLCPKCFKANNGPIGTHMIICWFRDCSVADAEVPGPGRWWAAGTGYSDLTLTGPSSSILLTGPGGCMWHGFVTNGEITDA